MAIRLRNTQSGALEVLSPVEPGHVRLYVCGLTVYDHAHVGHMRSALTYDVLVRLLREHQLRCTFVRNVTDIDDRILKRSVERGETPAALARRFEDAYRQDVRQLGCVEPDHEPRVSEHLGEIHQLIERLIARGAAYESDGDVYFSVQAFPEYGKLSHRKQSDLEYGASGRLDESELRRKRHPADFALWKRAKPGEPSWPSPWGDGHPGWHIECSAMAMRYLGETLDLHGGGLDLVFPHHENEIAQSEAATGKPFARMWVHNGFIEVNKEKMSKSLHNFMTARDCFRLAEPEALRYLCCTVHYRAPLGLDWSVNAEGQIEGCTQLEEAERSVEYIYRTRARLAAIPDARIADSKDEVPWQLGPKLRDALDDDLNTPRALAAMHEFLKHVNELAESAKAKKGVVARNALDAARLGFDALERILGLGGDDSAALLGRIRTRRAARMGLREQDVEQKIAERMQARRDRDFARADAIRDEVAARGIELMDGTDGTTWRIP